MTTGVAVHLDVALAVDQLGPGLFGVMAAAPHTAEISVLPHPLRIVVLRFVIGH